MLETFKEKHDELLEALRDSLSLAIAASTIPFPFMHDTFFLRKTCFFFGPLNVPEFFSAVVVHIIFLGEGGQVSLQDIFVKIT